jgi:hypothetical protein
MYLKNWLDIEVRYHDHSNMCDIFEYDMLIFL